MLEFLKIKHPDQIKNLIQDFNPNKQTWIVSDLKSKQEIQNICLKKYGFYQDESILRVSDFWQIWLRRLKPTLQVVSSDFIKVLVQLFIDDFGHEINMNESDFSSLNRYVQEFAPIILHPESDQIIDEWLQTQSEEKKWIEWYKKARVCLKFIVSEKKVLDQKWSAAFLQTLDLQQIEWQHEMIIDLGTELTSIEMGLFKILSQKQKVNILVPDPTWAQQFPYLLKTYNENLGLGKIRELTEIPDSAKQSVQFIRLSTQLAEIKHSVAQVREWLDQGVLVGDIALIAVEIEDYWPVLEKYLEIEGVPYRKDVVASLNSISSIQIFLAHLKSLTSDVSYSSLQQKLFQQNLLPDMKFEKFKSLFFQLYDENDLGRSELVKKLFYKKINLNEKISRDEFFTILVKVWAELPTNAQQATEKTNLFELVFKDLIAQSLETSMRFSRWYQFLKSRLSHKEIKIRAADVEGIQVLSLMSAQTSLAQYRIFLGMNEEFFQSKKKSMLPLIDIEKLKNDFDLAIDYPDENHFDFNLRWQVEQSCKEQILLSPHLSFLSEPLTGSAFFMQNLPQSEVMKPKVTRQDEIQSYLAHQITSRKEDKLKLYQDVVSTERIQGDLFGQSVLIPSEMFLSLSTSHLENYAQCSFKLLAAKGFRLQDLPEAAIDLDPRQKGSLVHSLFEYLLPLAKEQVFNLPGVEAFLDQKRVESELYLNEDLFWAVQKSKMLKLASKFYEFENQRIQFQNYTELNFDLYFDFQTQSFSKEKTLQSILIRGRIDRIDQEKQKKYYMVYDYKSSGSNIVHHSKWLTEFKLQLLIYMFAVETCLFEKAEVKGALYYLYKNFDLTKGFIDKDIAIQDLNFSKNSKSFIELEDKEKLKKEFIQFISEMFQNLHKGEFAAKPYDPKICIDCDWRKLCRAVHL